MSLHPEVEKEIEAGPQEVPIVAYRGGTGFPTKRETTEEFARRCVEFAVEKERQSNSEAAMKAHGASFDDLHICGNCNGTGYTV